MIKLNLPKNKKEQFKDVPFVENMSKYSMMVYIKNLYKILQQLAGVMDGRRPDVSAVIDGILDGKTWSEKEIDDRYIYAHYHDYILRFDTKSKRFLILDNKYQPLEAPVQGYTYREILERVKQHQKNRAA
jgi:hypothetical protein